MTDVERVTVANGAHNLSKQKYCKFFRERTATIDKVEEISAVNELKDEIANKVSSSLQHNRRAVLHFLAILPDIV